MKGEIITINGTPNPNSYIIKGSDNKTYLAHIGDLKDNEDLLIKHYNDHETNKLAIGDVVEFDLEPEHAMHVRKKK
jgi:hypothetical protein